MSLPLFVALYCLEAGVVLTVVPWTRIWTLNPFLHGHPAIGYWADNPYVRGFVSGVGFIHLIIGVKDIVLLRRSRQEAPPA